MLMLLIFLRFKVIMMNLDISRLRDFEKVRKD